MKRVNVALVGFGTVGKGVYDTIQSHQQGLQKVIGAPVFVSTIVVKNIAKHADFDGEAIITTDFQVVLDDPDIDIVFEAIVGKEPAFTYLKKSIQQGKHIITANKEMFAHYGKVLTDLAKTHHVEIGFEATTAGGIPIIQTIRQLLQVNQINKITAILNGTSNYILTAMRKRNLSFTDALKNAQSLGYAEADPSNDVEGLDAFYKLMILSELIFAQQPDWEKVKRIGIGEITTEQIIECQSTNKRIKPIAMIEKIGNRLHAQVQPCLVSEDHPFYTIEGAENAITIETDIVGQLTFTGPGAGKLPTASAMIEDFCSIMAPRKLPDRKPAFT